jgi:hypothetical protein
MEGNRREDGIVGEREKRDENGTRWKEYKKKEGTSRNGRKEGKNKRTNERNRKEEMEGEKGRKGKGEEYLARGQRGG